MRPPEKKKQKKEQQDQEEEEDGLADEDEGEDEGDNMIPTVERVDLVLRLTHQLFHRIIQWQIVKLKIQNFSQTPGGVGHVCVTTCEGQKESTEFFRQMLSELVVPIYRERLAGLPPRSVSRCCFCHFAGVP